MGAAANSDWNRSERCKQVDLLVPVLANPDLRARLLSSLPVTEKLSRIERAESDESMPRHFVWVLRDMFYFERKIETAKPIAARGWKALCNRWCRILSLKGCGGDDAYWIHPYKGDPNFLLHPCHRSTGWTEPSIRKRKPDAPEAVIAALIRAREIMNTECDCFIETPLRLIVIECKDKTSFLSEQKVRQRELHGCLNRLFRKPVQYVELCAKDTEAGFSWAKLERLLRT